MQAMQHLLATWSYREAVQAVVVHRDANEDVVMEAVSAFPSVTSVSFAGFSMQPYAKDLLKVCQLSPVIVCGGGVDAMMVCDAVGSSWCSRARARVCVFVTAASRRLVDASQP